MINKEKFTVQCEDGVILSGVLLIPESPRAVVQFNGGTATKKEFYLPFLEYLCKHHYICCLWDYRGSGESAPADLAQCDFTIRDYGLQDMPAVKAFLERRFGHLPLLLFVHSVGGQQIGFMADLEGYKGMVAFAVSTGYLPHMPLGYRVKSAFFFYVFTPLSIFLKGYLSSRVFGFMEDLPKNVVKEWRDWCEKETYFFDKAFYGKTVPTGKFNDIPFPIHVIWTNDDPIANPNSVKTFWNNVKSRHGITFDELTPQKLGLKSIGHFGFFRKKMRSVLWQKGLAKLDEYAA